MKPTYIYYITCLVAVICILAKIKIDDQIIMATLLYDGIEGHAYQKKTISESFERSSC
ncbi:hypothetical protein CLERM_071 [Coxiella-like endosymbiont]|nr:hypothetical protein CLERM_071 [Coxiella-like endosymbiont]